MSITFEEIKWTMCDCGRDYPNAHWSKPKLHNRGGDTPSAYHLHYNDKCTICRRDSGELDERELANGDIVLNN